MNRALSDRVLSFLISRGKGLTEQELLEEEARRTEAYSHGGYPLRGRPQRGRDFDFSREQRKPRRLPGVCSIGSNLWVRVRQCRML